MNTGDPWDARSLEWATHSPVPEYNFAVVPHIDQLDEFWFAKKEGRDITAGKYERIHMPNNSGAPMWMAGVFFLFGFFFVFSVWSLVIVFALVILGFMTVRSFEKDEGHYIEVAEIEETERRLRGEQ